MGIDYFMLGDGSYKCHSLTHRDNNASTYTFNMVKVNHTHLYELLFARWMWDIWIGGNAQL